MADRRDEPALRWADVQVFDERYTFRVDEFEERARRIPDAKLLDPDAIYEGHYDDYEETS